MSRRVRPASSPAPAPRRCSGSHYLPHCYQAATGSGCPQQEVMTPRRGARPPARRPIPAESSAAGGGASGRARGTGRRGDAPHVTGPTFLRHFEWWRRARAPRIVGTFAFAFPKLKDVTSDSCRPFPGSWRRDATRPRAEGASLGGPRLAALAASSTYRTRQTLKQAATPVSWSLCGKTCRRVCGVTACARTDTRKEGTGAGRLTGRSIPGRKIKRESGRACDVPAGDDTCDWGRHLRPSGPLAGGLSPQGRRRRRKRGQRGGLACTAVPAGRARCHAYTTLPEFPRCCHVSCPVFLSSLFSRNAPATLASNDPTDPARCPLHT